MCFSALWIEILAYKVNWNFAIDNSGAGAIQKVL